MSRQLPADCLNEIFEYLEEDHSTLHSCLFVNRLWCEISVRILWRNIWSFENYVPFIYMFKVKSAILSTLVACLPKKSIDLLYENEIFIPTPTSNPPLFNYPAFCKVFSITNIFEIIDDVLEKAPITSLSLKDRSYLVINEVIKMFMNQISSLKILTCEHFGYFMNLNNINFTSFSEAGDCLIDLSELYCNSNLPSEFFYHLSQKCHNLLSFTLRLKTMNFDIELKKLISLQNNLKNLRLDVYDEVNWTDIIPVLTKHSNTLTKLHLLNGNIELTIPLSFVASFPNLQEIRFTFTEGSEFEDFEKLQHVTFPKLQILNIPHQCPKPEYVMKFLENNGKNLKKFYIGMEDNNLNLSIAKFCSNLKVLSTIFNFDNLDTLKIIFNSCQHLESIKIWCGEGYLGENEVLETVIKYSPKNFYELKIYNVTKSKLLPEDLESFFISWKNRSPKKSLSFTIIKDIWDFLKEEEKVEI